MKFWMIWKNWFREYFSYNQNVAAILMAGLAAMSVGFVLFASPRPGCVDVGEYDQTLYRLGLARTAEDMAQPEERYFTKVIEEYAVTGVDMTRLLGGQPTESLIYPVALIGGICRLLGINFSTLYLAVFFLWITVISVYILTKSLYFYLGNRTAVVGILLCICMLTSDNITFFNSLYSNGMVAASFLFLLAMVLRALTREAPGGLSNVLPVLLAMYLFLTSCPSMPFLMIPMIPMGIYLIYKNKPEGKAKVNYWMAGGAAFFLLILLCNHFLQKNEQINARINLYNATFCGAFAAALDPAEALAFFGLPDDYQQDINKSYYLAAEEYVTAPYSEEAEELLYGKISYPRLRQYYLSHPDTFLRLLDQTLNLAQAGRDKFRYIRENDNGVAHEPVEKLGYYPMLRKLIMPDSVNSLLAVTVVILLATGILFAVKVRRKQRVQSCCLIWFLMALCWACLVITVFVYGSFDIVSCLFGFIIMEDILFIAFCMLVIYAVCEISLFLDWEKALPEEEAAYVIVGGPGLILARGLMKARKLFSTGILDSSHNTTLFMGGLAMLVMAGVLFFPERIGAYNNGDFGRMMDAMGLYYTDYDLLHQEEQYVTKVIETYVWLKDFDWSSVTMQNPSMSQTSLAVFVRLTAGAMGFQYSTVYATVLYWLLMSASFFAFVRGAYQLLGRKAAGLAAALIVVLFGSYNMGWFNSLFSEATEMAGLIMVMGAGLLILARERGTVKWYWWFVLLASIRFFIGSKAQVTPEVVFLVPWVVILAIYHRPPKLSKWIRQIVLVSLSALIIARSALIIYQKNNLISSGDTTYSSIFSGVLLLAEDPAVALEELGLDASLAADAGKSTYLDKSEYYCAPRTAMAEEMIYSKVDAIGVLKWYLTHPDKLWRMLDHAASESAAAMPDYFLYVGEKTTEEHRTVSKFNYWAAVRESVTPDAFWQYLMIYGMLILYCGRQILSKQPAGRAKMLALSYIILILIGALQFPLSVIGNGFIDNIKQLFVFRLVHDIVMTVAVFYGCLLIKQKSLQYGGGSLLKIKRKSNSNRAEIADSEASSPETAPQDPEIPE